MRDNAVSFDGIERGDGPMPAWWLWATALVIALAAGYWLFYQSFHIGKSPLEAYQAARLSALDTGRPVTEPELLAMAAANSDVKAGAALYKKNCTRCHGSRGEGKIGPNLTDAHWIAGGGPLDIFTTIFRGRAGKGMQAWGPTVGRGAVMQLTVFVLSIRNTNVTGKAPEGAVWEPPAGDAAAPP